MEISEQDLRVQVFNILLDAVVLADKRTNKNASASAVAGGVVLAVVATLVVPAAGVGTLIGMALGYVLGGLVGGGIPSTIHRYDTLLQYLNSLDQPARDILSQKVIANVSVPEERLIRRIVESETIFKLL